MIYGYARVSTAGQSPANQIADLQAAGCEKIIRETASGVLHRPRMYQLIRGLQPGDVLVVTRLDRIARTSLGLLDIVNQVAAKGAAFRSLVDHWADTSTPHGKLLISVLAGLAEFERELLLARTQEGRKAAMARGVKMGRKPALTDVQRLWVACQKRDRGMACKDMARLLGVHHSTITRIAPAPLGVMPPFTEEDMLRMSEGTGGGDDIMRELKKLIGQPIDGVLWAKLEELGCPWATGEMHRLDEECAFFPPNMVINRI